MNSKKTLSGKARRAKGIRGETEVRQILQDSINKIFVELKIKPIPTLGRNLQQAYGAGADIIGLSKLSVEVKYQETARLKTWWRQACEQTPEYQTPLLFYRRNLEHWKIIKPAGGLYRERSLSHTNLCEWQGIPPAQMSLFFFRLWFEKFLVDNLAEQKGGENCRTKQLTINY